MAEIDNTRRQILRGAIGLGLCGLMGVTSPRPAECDAEIVGSLKAARCGRRVPFNRIKCGDIFYTVEKDGSVRCADRSTALSDAFWSSDHKAWTIEVDR